MPPWGADNSGQCRTWRDASWLPDAEVRTLVEWAEGAKAEGDASRARPERAHVAPSFGPVGATAAMTGDYQPGLGPSAYRCFIVDPELTSDQSIAAFRVDSTEPRSVEQITLYALDSPEDELVAAQLDDATAGIGYTCYGSSRVPGARLLMSWTWDSPVMRLPAEYAVRAHARRKMVLQIHYNPVATGLGAPTRTRIDFELAPHAKEARYLSISPERLDLPPGQTRVEATATVSMPAATTVLAIAPRMHTLGKTMQLDRMRDANRECVANFDHWSFYRQRLFEYTSPLRVDAGDKLRISCVYNTQSRSKPTSMGDTIDDEQCSAALLVAP
jgi:hypothetical protein